MESKITIDIRNDGVPFIKIDFKPSDDLRDKVVGRFLCESGALLNNDGTITNPNPLNLHILYNDEKTGRAEAMIELIERK